MAVPLARRWSWAALVIGMLLSVASQADCATREECLEPSGAPFPVFRGDYHAHLREVEVFLARAKACLPEEERAEAVALNMPFELRADPDTPYRGRFLLVHGLNDGPYSWHDVARALSRGGYDVRAVLLSGHGSRPGDMLDASHRDWLDAVRTHADAWRRESGAPLFLGGFSTGGIIAALLAMEREDIAGLLLFAPAFRSDMASRLRWAPLLGLVRDWVFVRPAASPVRHGALAVNAAAQYHHLSEEFTERIGAERIAAPTFAVLTATDSVLDMAYVRGALARGFSGSRVATIYTDGEDVDGFAHEPHERPIPGRFPADGIRNLSHMGMMFSPDNPLYGRQGSVILLNGRDAGDPDELRGQDVWRGAWGTPSPDGKSVVRSTYNPDFERLMSDMLDFFAAQAN